MIVQCCQCRKVKQGERWKEPSSHTLLQEQTVTHTYCPACAELVLQQIQLYERSKGAVSAVV